MDLIGFLLKKKMCVFQLILAALDFADLYSHKAESFLYECMKTDPLVPGLHIRIHVNHLNGSSKKKNKKNPHKHM